jgi:hypothetical protein
MLVVKSGQRLVSRSKPKAAPAPAAPAEAKALPAPAEPKALPAPADDEPAG